MRSRKTLNVKHVPVKMQEICNVLISNVQHFLVLLTKLKLTRKMLVVDTVLPTGSRLVKPSGYRKVVSCVKLSKIKDTIK